MNLGGIIYPALNAYDGVAYEIYVSGCSRNCPNCHSPQLQDFNYGKELDWLAIVNDIEKKESWIDIISILGGDLLCQKENQAKGLSLVLKMSYPNKKLWLFTGSDFKDIPQWCFEYFDVIKYGRYVEELKQEGFPASSNQKVIRKGVDY